MTKGTITRLTADQTSGFIQTEKNEAAFFHRRDLRGITYRSLREGQQVEFDVIHTLRGLKAVSVRLPKQKRHPEGTRPSDRNKI